MPKSEARKRLPLGSITYTCPVLGTEALLLYQALL